MAARAGWRASGDGRSAAAPVPVEEPMPATPAPLAIPLAVPLYASSLPNSSSTSTTRGGRLCPGATRAAQSEAALPSGPAEPAEAQVPPEPARAPAAAAASNHQQQQQRLRKSSSHGSPSGMAAPAAAAELRKRGGPAPPASKRARPAAAESPALAGSVRASSHPETPPTAGAAAAAAGAAFPPATAAPPPGLNWRLSLDSAASDDALLACMDVDHFVAEASSASRSSSAMVEEGSFDRDNNNNDDDDDDDAMLLAAASSGSLDSLAANTAALGLAGPRSASSAGPPAAALPAASAAGNGLFYGLPASFRDLLKELRGITDLYDWQAECVQDPRVQAGTNLVYSLPTSGGKTLVAEILMFRALLMKRRHAIMIFPYTALVEEKISSLRPFARHLGITLEVYAGSRGRLPPLRRPGKTMLYLCTIEKASILIDHMLEAQTLGKVGAVVVDELHMLGDESRGAGLEVTLTKLLLHNQKLPPVGRLQIVGMSATISNLVEVANFLEARMYVGDFRPVELHEYVCVANNVFKAADFRSLYLALEAKDSDQPPQKQQGLSCKLPSCLDSIRADFRPVLQLLYGMCDGSSCLVFCPRVDLCQRFAENLSKAAKSVEAAGITEANCFRASADVRQRRDRLLASLRVADSRHRKVFAEIIPHGVAFHSSDLSSEERALIEEGFRKGTLWVLMCTSTLAAGVNLPARRVIIQSPKTGTQPLTRARYRQMCGRAGRAGFDHSGGESVLLLTKAELGTPAVRQLLEPGADACIGRLADDGGLHIQQLVLSLIGASLATTHEQLSDFFDRTLTARQEQTLRVHHLVDAGLRELMEQDMVERPGMTSHLYLTPLGHAIFHSHMEPNLAKHYKLFLNDALKRIQLHPALHLIYLIVPLDTPAPFVNVKKSHRTKTDCWNHLFNQFEIAHHSKEKEHLRDVFSMLGISGGMLQQAKVSNFPDTNASKAVAELCRQLPIESIRTEALRRESPKARAERLYVAMILHRIVEDGEEVSKVAEEFRVSFRTVQALLRDASTNAIKLSRFCKEIPSLRILHLLFDDLVKRLSLGVPGDLVELMEVPGVKQSRAHQLHRQGFSSFRDLAAADTEELAHSVQPPMSLETAEKIKQACEEKLREKAAELEDEAKELIYTLSRRQ